MLRATPRATARPVLRRLLVGAAASLAAAGSLTAAPPAASAQPGGADLLSPVLPDGAPDRDHLTVTVRNAGDGADGTFELYCGPDGGSHPDPSGACDALERDTRWGRDVFAPSPEGGFCTMQYGGPATAHVTGTWAGRPVDARYDRRDGCQISRWDRLVPLLPGVGGGQGAKA
ncbi:SSI family serine proteinase inhibitor [Streptomyces sp. NPDC007984]|uniref:SSI family serine proteinase inhibitor n=1 Tax=Streptomyces sp. NPDC007984 TaxID=3364801 RepID=UPI0036E2C34E